jgi:hypothetical protein
MQGRLDRAVLACFGGLSSRFEASDAHIGLFAFMQKGLKLSLQYCKTMFYACFKSAVNPLSIRLYLFLFPDMLATLIS